MDLIVSVPEFSYLLYNIFFFRTKNALGAENWFKASMTQDLLSSFK